MTTQIYQVPVVSNGLRETESILQIVDSLEKLEKVFNEMYTTISTRVAHEKSRIDNVASRLNNAQHKVNQIVGSKQAITVFSSAKYPAEKKWSDYVPIYSGKSKLPFKPSHYHLHNDEQIKNRPDDSYMDLNDLVFIEKSIDAASKEVEIKEGLGRLPSHLPSVSNLLLFNTQENPYKKYSNTLDNLAGGSGEDQVAIFGEGLDTKKKKKLGSAPVTVEKGDIRPEAENVKINYEPGTFEIPVYNFPSALPLPNVAENITWAANDAQQSIAPSQQVVLNLLPTYDSLASPDNNNNNQAQQNNINSNNNVPPPSTANVPPPPPPPSSGAPPPPPPPPPVNAPPPPPPPPSMNNNSNNNNNDDDDDDENRPSDGSAIGDLLADIRRGHKNRLKKVEEKDEDEEDDGPPPPSQSSGGNLMGDLFKALALRRQSIATVKGGKKQTKSKKQEQQDDDQDDDDQDGESDSESSGEWE